MFSLLQTTLEAGDKFYGLPASADAARDAAGALVRLLQARQAAPSLTNLLARMRE